MAFTRSSPGDERRALDIVLTHSSDSYPGRNEQVLHLTEINPESLCGLFLLLLRFFEAPLLSRGVAVFPTLLIFSSKLDWPASRNIILFPHRSDSLRTGKAEKQFDCQSLTRKVRRGSSSQKRTTRIAFRSLALENNQ
jgi:hypothetical protein